MPEPPSWCDKCGNFREIVETEGRWSQYHNTYIEFELCGYCTRTADRASFIDTPIKW